MLKLNGYFDPISGKICAGTGESLCLRKFDNLESAQQYAAFYTNIVVVGYYRTPAEARELMDGLLAVA